MRRVGRRAWLGLVAVLVFDVWWRCHTVGPAIRETIGVSLYPAMGVASEPLDCDEAIYAYIGKRIAHGAVMYRDLTENKPPMGYWLFALGIAIGGDNELTVRLMPIPLVLATAALVWWLGLRLKGPGAAFLAGLLYSILSTDPFLYGNGNQMEHMINLPATAALAWLVSTWDRPGRWRLTAVGICVGLATLVKQVAAAHLLVVATALCLRTGTGTGENFIPRRVPDRLKDVGVMAAGFAGICLLAAMIVMMQGAGRAAIDDIFRYGRALATDLPADPHAPPLLVRWVTGNADPAGVLPWPFGTTKYLFWWGTGSWPVWLCALPALAWLVFGPGTNGPRRCLVAWTLSCWAQVALPRLFWHHYYLLPVPALSIVIAVVFAEMTERGFALRLFATILGAAMMFTFWLQCVNYLRLSPEQVVEIDKRGRQWITYRELGRDLKKRLVDVKSPTIFVWGWQSPLFFYSGFDGVTRQVFTDDLIKTFAEKNHPLIRPRIDRTIDDLRANRPTIIFAGYPPFPALRDLLREHYFPDRDLFSIADGRGLWVEKGHYVAYKSRSRRAATITPMTPAPPPADSRR